MDPHLEEHDGGTAALPAADPLAPARRPGRPLWPLAALAFTTATLAASAWQVVASSIVEGSPGSGPTRPSAHPADPSASPCGCDMDACEGPGPVDEPGPGADDPPSPPAPSTIPPRRPVPQAGPQGRPKVAPVPTPAKPAVDQPPPAPRPDARRIVVRGPDGRPLVARVHGQDGTHVAAILPDGQIGYPDGLVDTDKPFVPFTIAETRDKLLAGEFAGFRSLETKHYVVLYQGSRNFAADGAKTLEDLLANLMAALGRRKISVHEPEFPLVAVIFRTEEEFREHKKVSPDVQAYYEIGSNRIFLYESSRRDEKAPEVSALRKPQTVAHEGTHQILQNIGVHPRLSPWPLWLVEGLAEYCASPSYDKKGQPAWQKIGQINYLHVATIRDLDDPLSTMVPGANSQAIARDPKRPLLEYLVTRTELTPTDYALSWGLTYHLAIKQHDAFVAFLREMSQLPPLSKRTSDDHLRSFRAAFGKIDADVLKSLRRLTQTADPLPYYAVVFEQPIGGGLVHRAAMVSQSPLFIRQWIEDTTSPRGEEPRWQVFARPTKARALLTAEEWLDHGG